MDREPLFELRRTTFDTPEFRGIEFIEAEVKSIINHVPGTYLPFNWTINPYRGCLMSCVYCLAGDTPVLMGDGRQKPIALIEPGEEVFGTTFDGKYRRFVRTRVLDRWETCKPAYRVVLEDGTTLISSGDHRFLTNRGWKFVTGRMAGSGWRPYLTTANSLVGVGALPEGPKHSSEYRRGYLCGIIRGDAYIRFGPYLTRSGATRHQDAFRLALTDVEALDRVKEFLSDLGVKVSEFVFAAPSEGRRELRAIRARSRDVQTIARAIEWPADSSADWAKGFLAGIYDAEGGRSRGILRVCNTDQDIVRWLLASLTRFGFRYAVEVRSQKKPLLYVRVLGGLPEHLRLFQLTDPAISRKRTISDGSAIKHLDKRLRVVAVESLGFELPMYDIATGTGDFIANGIVSHNCFARTTHTYLDMGAGKDWQTKIVVKVNGPDVLRRQLGSKRWKGEHIAMGTATDPYQRAEGRYKLMPRIIGALTDYRNPFSILTKGTLILRDLPLLVEAAKVAPVSTAFSIGTLDEEAWKVSEPGTPHPKARLEAVAALNEAGIPCGVLIAPILPGITDHPDQLRAVVEGCIEAGATHASPILLHLRPGIREEYMPWLAEHFPDLVPRYEAMYRLKSGYASKPDQNALAGLVRDLVAEAGGFRPPPQAANPRFRRGENGRRAAKPKPQGEQLSLL